ncbi:AraC-like DNA-binding protein [Flavobacterium endophyticum]|uniref:AraC-like DNA-binding protein n=1 Tax=Flavobacterium endophyticum TaxID=1540163 RepID=A0A495MDE0_9FLAO|nr:AraC family transcriptional regulator [Flavobacterium endophyticum]RKS23112.1 AraC-like DNA-binding protein [Flavobacterium endophyticum]
MHFYIKNMVCNRCKMAVQKEFEKTGLMPITIELGEVETAETISKEQLEELENALKHLGFELIDDKKSRLIEQIKTEIIRLIHHSEEIENTNLSSLLSEKLHYEYNYISNLFSEVEGTTIEKYFIAQRIEKVKELLVYDELSLSQIAIQLGYSSTAYLSSQFKKVTGLTPTFYKSLKETKRKNIDEL